MAIQFAAAAVLVVVLLFGGANAQFDFGDVDTANNNNNNSNEPLLKLIIQSTMQQLRRTTLLRPLCMTCNDRLMNIFRVALSVCFRACC